MIRGLGFYRLVCFVALGSKGLIWNLDVGHRLALEIKVHVQALIGSKFLFSLHMTCKEGKAACFCGKHCIMISIGSKQNATRSKTQDPQGFASGRHMSVYIIVVFLTFIFNS
jgi:hypothetical protein